MILTVPQTKKLVFACEEHVDMAIDDFLVANETFPVLNEAKEVKCSYCEKTALYVLNSSE